MLDKINLRLLDLLTILLPGGLLLLLGLNLDSVNSIWYSWQNLVEESWQKASLFLATSFVLGHFIYLLASGIDNLIFEKVRKVYYSGAKLLAYVIQLKKEILGFDDFKVINSFKWSLAILMHQHPELYAAVEQHIAASKFFRSFFVVLMIAFFALLFQSAWIKAFVVFVLAVLSLMRYYTQRVKSIDSAYHYVLVASGKRFDTEPDAEMVKSLEGKYYTNTFPEGIQGHLQKVWLVVKLIFSSDNKDSNS